MGVSVTCSGESFESLHDSLDTLLKSLSLSSKDDMIKSTHRSISLNERSFKTEEKTWGSGKLVIKGGSLSFNKKKESFHVESETSREIPICQKDTPQVQVNDDDNNNNNRNTRFAPMPAEKISQPDSPKHQAALRLQKVYKSFRTRRQLADCAVLIEQRWWKLLDFAMLKRSSVSFFEGEKTESVLSKWARAKSRAAKVGKGLSKDEKARKLALQHWLEAIDPRHRYGHNLQFYYDRWLRCESKQPFFYWLDVGEGKEASFDEKCPRSKLQQQCIKYLGPKEREDYEVIVEDGKLMYKKSGQVLDSIQGPKDSKWIFVLSTSKNLYVGQKKKGVFQHSSFLAGGATSAAGRLEIENGILKAIWPHSGHYRPTEENFQEFVTFLKEKNIDLTNVKKSPVEEEEEEEEEKCSKLRPSLSDNDSSTRENKENSEQGGSNSSNGLKRSGSFHASPSSTPKKKTSEDSEESEEEEEPGEKKTKETSRCIFKRNNYRFRKPNLFVGREEETVPSEAILGRMKFKKEKLSLQLGKQLSCRWTTGAGPRIGCVRDYPSMLRCLALEQVNLSPRNEGATRDFPSPWKFPSSIPRANSLNSLNNTPERDL